MKIRKKLNRKTIIYIISMVIFIVALLSVNSIIAFIIRDENSLKKIDFSDLESNGKVYYNIEDFNISSDIFELVHIYGWAFCETMDFSDEKTVSVIFKNIITNTAYISTTLTSIRHDVRAAFPDLQVNLHNAFAMSFSTLSMKSGIYEMYLYVHENDENYGLVDTGKNFFAYFSNFEGIDGSNLWRIVETFIPKRKVSTEIENNEKIENFENVTMTEEVKYYFSEREERNKISGWAFLEDKLADEQQIFIQITDKSGKIYTDETSQSSRNDVGTHFNDDRYNYSGFSVTLKDDIDLENAKINIIIENDGLFMSSDFYYGGE